MGASDFECCSANRAVVYVTKCYDVIFNDIGRPHTQAYPTRRRATQGRTPGLHRGPHQLEQPDVRTPVWPYRLNWETR